MDLASLRDILRQFASERDWEKFHSPRNLTLALVGEVGELAELMQWRSDDEVMALAANGRSIPDELADVLVYLVRLADVLGIDLEAAVIAKMAVNDERYPADDVRGSAEKRSAL